MGVFFCFLLLLLSIGCRAHSVTKRQALFQDVVRQRTHGNRIAQCPCVIHPESRQCISYDSRYQATGPEEAMLAFIDLSNGRYAPNIVNSATFSCNSAECQHCFALLYYRLQEVGMLPQNYRTVVGVLPRNRIVANLCPRFKFPLPPVIPAVPSQQPDYVRSMISAGLRFSHSASTALPRQFNNRGRFRPGPRLQDQRPSSQRTRQRQQQQRQQQQQQRQQQPQVSQQRQVQQPVQPQWQQQQRQQPQQNQQTQQQQWQQNQANVQQQQPVQQAQQQPQQWTQPTAQQPSTQWNGQWNQQQPNVVQPTAPNWGQAAAATGAIVGSVLDATSQWAQRQPRPRPPIPQPTPPPPQQPAFPQPQFPQPQFPQPQQPQAQPGWNNPNWGPRPEWGNNGHHWGQEGQWWPNGHHGGNWGQAGQPWQQPGGGGPSMGGGPSVGGGVQASVGGGVVPQVASVLSNLPFTKRSKRAAPALIGRRFTIGCTNRGEASLNDDGDFLSLCGSCWTWRELPDDYFPRILNELSCQEGDFCLSGWGQCKQQFRNVDVLRHVDGRWVPTVITTATCCDCRVKAGTEIHALVVGDKKRT